MRRWHDSFLSADYRQVRRKKALTAIPELSIDELQTVLDEAKEPVIVEFFTRSCGPCKRVVPMLEEIRREFSNKLTIVRVDIEKEPQLAAKFDVASVPTLLVFVNGNTYGRIVGAVPKKDLLRMIHENLLSRKTS